MFMHTKSPKLYEPIRVNKIIYSKCYLNYAQLNCNSGFGFINKIFQTIAQKNERCWAKFKTSRFIIDEMKLIEKFQAKNWSQIEGFIDIGPYTPTRMKSTLFMVYSLVFSY